MSDGKVVTADQSLQEDVAKLDAMLAPDLKYEMITMETANSDDRARIGELMDDIDLSDSNSILFYGSNCLLYTSPSPRDRQKSRMPSSA